MSGANETPANGHLVIYLPDLSGGGAERLHLHLAQEFLTKGLKVTFLLNRLRGELLTHVPAGAEVVSLEAPRLLKAFPGLTHYLKAHKPDWLISNMEHANILSIFAKRLAGVDTHIIVTQHISLLKQAERKSWQFKVITGLYRLCLGRADAIVCVSKGVADELVGVCGLPLGRFDVIYNGLVREDRDDTTGPKAEHEIFSRGAPVVLSIGRMVAQKDHATLIRAIARTQANLLILGAGPLQLQLEALAAELSVTDRVVFGGYVGDPKPYLRAADLFVLSSIFEGFGNVLVEAMGCGTRVVSTDCPFGPSEILDNGRFGKLAPVSDPDALSEAIIAALNSPAEKAALRQRALTYSIEACATNYVALMTRLKTAKAAA